jgi:hypothetical protein
MNGKGTMSRVIKTIYYTRTSCAPCVLSNKGGHVHSSDEPEACTKKISSFSRILWAYCRIQIFYIQKESLTMEGYFIISFCSHKNEQMK